MTIDRCRACRAVFPVATAKFCVQCGRARRKHSHVQSAASSGDGHWFWGNNNATSHVLPPLVSSHAHVTGPPQHNQDDDDHDQHDEADAVVTPDVKPALVPLKKQHTATRTFAVGSLTWSNQVVIEEDEHSVRSRDQTARPTLARVPSRLSRQRTFAKRHGLAPLQRAMTQFSDEDPYDVVAAAVERSNVHDTASAPAGFLWGTASDSALASFRAKEIILLAEIEADELCSCHLSQRVLVERDLYRQNHRYASTTLTELESKQLSLNRKIQVNQEKLLHVRARIAELTANPLVLGTKPALDPVTAAAVRIQTAFRRDKARRAFQQLVRRVVQKVYDPASQQYFFYNHHTGVSQWQIPAAIHAAIADEPQHHSQKGGDIVEAATMIQGLFRRRAARRALHALLAQVYQKVEDPETGLYYYYSKRTGVSQWNKPKLLGASELPSPLRTPALEPHSAPGSDEDQQTRAVRTIQRLYRTRASRAFLRDLLGGTIEKVYDADFDAWYYFNHRTQQSFWESLSMQPWRMLLRPGVASATRSS